MSTRTISERKPQKQIEVSAPAEAQWSPLWWAVLAVYSAVVLFTISRHEPWFDEAQAWLLARDLNYFDLLTHYLRYEGTPPLWHTVLFLAVRLGLPYAAMGWIGGIFAIAGMFVFLRFAPFPWPIKLVLPFTFFYLYQYAAVARSYVMLPLFAFLTAKFYKEARDRTVAFTVSASLLANVSAQGTLIAAGLVGAYAIGIWRSWRNLDPAEKRRHLYCAVAFALVMAAVAAIGIPPKDSNFLRISGHGERPGFWTAFTYGAISLFDIPTVPGRIASLIAALISLVVFLGWSQERKALLSYLLPVGSLFVFFGAIYVAFWHQGTMLTAVVVSLWIAWPSASELHYTRKRAGFSYKLAVSCLFLILLSQVPAALMSVNFDIRNSYCGAKEVADYLRKDVEQGAKVAGLGFRTAAILPYYNRNIFINQQVPAGTSFWRWSVDNHANACGPQILSERPEYVVVAIRPKNSPVTASFDVDLDDANDFLVESGYHFEYKSSGVLWWKTDALLPNWFWIYKRNN